MKSINTRTQYKIVGSDFSAQEPRLTAFYSQDENMINAYIEGRDLYSVIASMSFDRKYEDCLEFYPQGTKVIVDGKEVTAGYKDVQNKEGKTYRTMAKSILLGLLYGRSAASIGEQIKKSPEEAQEIVNKFFNAFPKVKNWIDQTIENCRKLGYVEDIAGRKRRLPDIQLPKFTVKYKDASKSLGEFNPFIGCGNRTTVDKALESFKKDLQNARSRKQIDEIKKLAESKGITIINNGGFISQAERQCVNARVQGGAATLTKCALIDIYNDDRLRKLKAKLINTVHDEILIEAPRRYAEEAAKYLTEDMINAAKRYVENVPMSCDPYIVNGWYLDEYAVTVQEEFKKMLEKNIDPMQAFEMMCEDRIESTRSQIYEIVKGFLPEMPKDVEIIDTL